MKIYVAIQREREREREREMLCYIGDKKILKSITKNTHEIKYK